MASLLLSEVFWQSNFSEDVAIIKPLGDIFLNLLQSFPLIFFLPLRHLSLLEKQKNLESYL
jgi:Na+/H+-dicarboxylate symporter